MDSIRIQNIIAENRLRVAKYHEPYDPTTGLGSPVPRFPMIINEELTIYLPESMRSIELIEWIIEAGGVEKFCQDAGIDSTMLLAVINKERLDHDFEYWAATTVKIEDKLTLELIPFILRKSQRKLLWSFEKQRLTGKPIRTTVCKARQWGGSTLTQMYMAWIQQRLKKNWHSAVVAHLDDPAKNIRGMYSRMAENYPEYLGKITLKPWVKSQKNLICPERGCIVGVGSVENPDQFRAYNYPMIHMSEVAFWGSTVKKNADKLAQSLRTTVPNVPYSMIVLESTAQGQGNFFHREWEAAIQGRSVYDPVFVAWWEIEDLYEKPVDDYETFIRQIENSENREYLWSLWEVGATLEGIKWYIEHKAAENYSDLQMFQEFPTTAAESFSSTGNPIFNPLTIALALKSCHPPIATGRLVGLEQKGEGALKDLRFEDSPTGALSIWSFPDTTVRVSNRYVIIADIGGKTAKADFSVIRVLDRYWMMDGGSVEAVATWHAHLDQDLFAWVCIQVALWYNNGLLIIESNSLRKELAESEGNHFLTVLNEIARHYNNLYARTSLDKIRTGVPIQYGFHTNDSTKPMVITSFNAALRDWTYVERDARVIAECSKFEQKMDGTMGGIDGSHDDLVIATAIGEWASTSYMPLPKELTGTEKMRTKKKAKNMSSF